MSMTNILPEPEKSNISLYNVLLYNKWSCRNYSNNPAEDDELFIVYRDSKGKKKVHIIPKPPMEIYFVKPEYRTFMTCREYIEMDKVDSVKIEASKVRSRIYNEVCKYDDIVSKQLKKIYDSAVATQQWDLRNEIFKWPYVCMADMKIEHYYMIHMAYHYNLDHPHIIDKAFADIENDIYGLSSSETRANLDPVNACTIIFRFDENGSNKDLGIQEFTFLLRDHKRYPQQEEFEKNIDKFYQVCHEEFDKQTIIKDGLQKVVDLSNTHYHIVMCKDEVELIESIFSTINRYKPDICEFWNMPYDMPKLKARMEILGMNPIQTISDKEFFPENAQFVSFHMDNRPIDIANRNSYITATTTTNYVDQMQNYASIRKGRKAYGNNTLDNIANIELGMGKRKFAKGIDVTNAAIMDYWNFVLYNIRDVWAQFLVDYVTNDTMTLIYDMNQHNTPLYHLAKQLNYQKCIYYCEYLRRGYVPGDNPNVKYASYKDEDEQSNISNIKKRIKLREALDKSGMDVDDIAEIMQNEEEVNALIEEYCVDENEDIEIETMSDIAEEETAKVLEENVDIFKDSIDRKLRLPGGLVGDPNLNSANGAELIQGVHSKHVYTDAFDADYSSEYPWAKYTRSISRSTQIGRLIIPDKISPYQNMLPFNKPKRKIDNSNYLPGAEFTGDYLSNDILSFGTVWFNLPFAEDCSKMIDNMIAGKDMEDGLNEVTE